MSVTGGSLDIASLTSTTASYLAIAGSGFGLNVTLGPLSASGTGLAFLYNSGPSGHEINNWSFTGLSGFASPLADDLVKVSGSATVTLTGLFASVSIGDFALTRTPATAHDELGATVNGQLFSLHLG